ncbi:MAG: hypothetical protein UZ13_01774 [Chloroflexi bacterium OLB13]|nr:MAG: hypothetical protein UZ13_01774 [Chloroflexi bacterium OLB13]
MDYWVLQGTPESALDLVTVTSYDVPNAPPIEIYQGMIQRRYDNITKPNPLDAGSHYVLVYLAPDVLAGRRFWWLIEDVQPQFEVLIDVGIRVYSTADPDAPLRSPVPKGELVVVTGVSPDKNWYKIRSRRGEGWISAGLIESDAVRFLGDPNDVPTIIPPPLPATPDGSTTPGTPESEATAEPTAEPSPSG